ncbi:fungal-specific transcription factor domain-containing protein [Mariannaea sp. PMI_226]|nr:fungal-specific transcription factor domain-containing protein [Mariannaea sp. PMI_226]
MSEESNRDANSTGNWLNSDRAQPWRRSEVPTTSGRSRRATRACDNCRRLREKCNGGVPCDRCNKSGRQCMFTEAFRRTRNPQNPGPSRSRPPPDAVDPTTFFEVERIRTLESIVKHFTGIEQCTKTNLQEVVASIQADKGSPYQSDGPGLGELERMDTLEGTRADSSTTLPVEEFSHSEFSRRLQQKVETQSERCQNELGSGVIPTQQLLSRDFVVYEAVSLFPPSQVALLLIDVFFNVAQTNYFYVDEGFLRHKISEFYGQATRLSITDAPWVCTTLMVFAVGTQFAHLASSQRGSMKRGNGDMMNISSAMDDTLALAFFRKATSLVPDVMAISSPQSVQAFGLLGIYVLPLDPAGLSCTYFGVAIKIATQNGMHKKNNKPHKTKEMEIRNRIWWTVYTLERRISILHGRPPSIPRSEINADASVDMPELQPSDRVNTFHNVVAQKGITEIMEDARDAILTLKKADKSKIPTSVKNVLKVKQRLETWWTSLPEETFCRDLTPGKPLFRSNIHLALTYHLAHIFMGRSFIFDDVLKPQEPRGGKWANVRDELIDNCVKSAATSIELCQVLKDEFGLSKSSYTEFTSCCAAVLALVAQRICAKNDTLKDLCNQGLLLLKTMSSGVFAQSCERKGLEILEMALQKLDGSHKENPSLNGTGYTEFRNWVAMQQIVPGETPRQDEVLPQMAWSSEGGLMPGTMHQQDFTPSMLADLSSLPGLDEWFQYSIN